MRLIIAFVVCLSTLNVLGQCTFERFWDYYTWPAGTKSRVLPLSDGGYLVYCTAEHDSLTYGNAQTHLIQFKTDACGTKLWTNDSGYIGDGDPDMKAIEMEDGNYMIVGYTAAGLPGSLGNIRVGKYNKNGQLLKEKLLIGSPVSGFIGAKKSSKSNSYLIYGYTYIVQSNTSAPLIAEIDNNLNVVKWTQMSNERIGPKVKSTGQLSNIFQINDTTYLSFLNAGSSLEDTLFLGELDSLFNIRKIRNIRNDSIKEIGFYEVFLSEDSTEFIGIGLITFNDDRGRKYGFIKLSVKGDSIRLIEFLDYDRLPICMNQTKDGGYILGGWYFTMKVDSSFNIQWQKEVRGRIYSIAQTNDGGYVASGLSSELIYGPFSKPYFRPYLVKMDSVGNYIETGIEEEKDKSMYAVYIYPNPANTTLTIQSSQKYATIELWNTTGSLVLKETNSPTTIDVSSLPQGVYMLRVLGSQQEVIATHKVSVLH